MNLNWAFFLVIFVVLVVIFCNSIRLIDILIIPFGFGNI